MNTGMIQASYSMIERVGQALTASRRRDGPPGERAGGWADGRVPGGHAPVAGRDGTDDPGRAGPQQYEAAGDEEDEDEVEEPPSAGAQGVGQAFGSPLTVLPTAPQPRAGSVHRARFAAVLQSLVDHPQHLGRLGRLDEVKVEA